MNYNCMNWGSKELRNIAILGNSFEWVVLQVKRFVREAEKDGTGKEEKVEEENAIRF